MKRLVFAMFLTLLAGVAKADDNQAWLIQNGGNWTANDNVSVSYWFTEAGTTLGAAQLFIGPLLTADAPRPVVTTQFVGSNRTICLNADAYRAAAPTVRVSAVPDCYKFPFLPLNPAIIKRSP